MNNFICVLDTDMIIRIVDTRSGGVSDERIDSIIDAKDLPAIMGARAIRYFRGSDALGTSSFTGVRVITNQDGSHDIINIGGGDFIPPYAVYVSDRLPSELRNTQRLIRAYKKMRPKEGLLINAEAKILHAYRGNGSFRFYPDSGKTILPGWELNRVSGDSSIYMIRNDDYRIRARDAGNVLSASQDLYKERLSEMSILRFRVPSSVAVLINETALRPDSDGVYTWTVDHDLAKVTLSVAFSTETFQGVEFIDD